MHLNKLNIRNTFVLVSVFFFGETLLSGCITSSRQDQLQASIDKLQNQIIKVQNQLSSKDQQINNTTQTAIASQNEAQGLHEQLQLTQGAVDEIKNRLKKIEENAGANSNTNAPNVVTINSNSNGSSNTDLVYSLQKQVARLELITNSRLTHIRKGKMPVKIKNIADLNKSLKANYDSGNFKQVVDLATNVLLAHDATEPMLAAALEYRGEARFQLQDYRGAASDLAGVTELFVNAPRKARALLLAGDSYVYLKNNSVALLYYQDCAKNFATAAEGKAAASRLSNLTVQ